MEKIRKGPRNETRNKYLKVCYDIKNKCDNKIKFNLRDISIEHRISHSLSTFLRKKNVAT